MRAPLPADEQDRLRALRRLDVLDTPPEPEFDDIAALAAAVCGTPISLVSFIDSDRQWFKARVGVDRAETPRDLSFCAHAILGRDLLVVPDARVDGRFADNPAVCGEPGVRFYAGAPLVTSEGFALGTLCVVDLLPRRLNVVQMRALRALARQSTAQLELRRYAAGLRRSLRRQQDMERVAADLASLITSPVSDALAEIRHCVEMLRDTAGCPPELATRLGAAAHGHAPSLLRLLDDLLRIGPAPADEPALERRAVDLASLTEWAVREVRPIGEAKDIPLRLEIPAPADPPVVVRGDPRRLGQALSHLLFTAVKFTPPGGLVRVRVDGAAGPAVHLHDIGAYDQPPSLYEHFYHGAFARPAGELGPDAGLAAVKAILDVHHAAVALSDRDATTLHVTFPQPG